MFSVSFQKLAVASYGAALPWEVRDIYFVRIIGSFAFVLGYLAAMAAVDPLKYKIVVIGFVEFFMLRNLNRHLYSQELYSGFGVSPLVNDLTTVFFGAQAVLLGFSSGARAKAGTHEQLFWHCLTSRAVQPAVFWGGEGDDSPLPLRGRLRSETRKIRTVLDWAPRRAILSTSGKRFPLRLICEGETEWVRNALIGGNS